MRGGRRPVPRGRARLWEHGRGGWRPWTQAPRLLWGGTQGVRPVRSPSDRTQVQGPEPLLTGSCLPPLLRVLGPRAQAGHPLRATRFLVLSPGVGVSVLMVKLTYRPAPHRPLPEAPAAPRSPAWAARGPPRHCAGRSRTAGRATSAQTLCIHPARRSRRLSLGPNRAKCEEKIPFILFRVLLFPCGQNFNLYLLFNSV